jgi:hypothetical protein
MLPPPQMIEINEDLLAVAAECHADEDAGGSIAYAIRVAGMSLSLVTWCLTLGSEHAPGTSACCTAT